VLQVDADARPGPEAAAHGVDEYVSGLKMRARVRVAGLPAFETGQDRVLVSRASNLDERMGGNPTPRR